jgi:hypothetical protein
VDAIPDAVFLGTVKSIAPLADSTRNWQAAGGKEYATVIALDDPRGRDLRPGMTAETRIVVSDPARSLVVPRRAVAEQKGTFVAFVDGPDGLEPRKVRPGAGDETSVEIHEGIREGEHVALDAQSRLAGNPEVVPADLALAPDALPRTETLARGH